MTFVVTTERLLSRIAAPRLPAAPVDYEQRYHDQFADVLRLYFNRLDSLLAQLQAQAYSDGSTLQFPHGSFYDTTDQTAADTTTAYAITLNTTALSNQVTVENSSEITFAVPGIYNIQFSVQLTNDDNASQDIDVWFEKNGANIADSNSRFGLAPRKSAGNPYHVVGALNLLVEVDVGDYVQLFWRTSNVAARIEHYAASTTPTRPVIPSVIVSATFVSAPTP